MESVVVIRAGAATERQKIGYTVGVSAEVCGSTGLSLSYVVVPPGGFAEAHFHDGTRRPSTSSRDGWRRASGRA